MQSTSSDRVSPIVSVQNVSFAYPSPSNGAAGEWALHDLTLSFQTGQISAVMGPTGAGKSTLAKALLGIVPQSSGGRIRGGLSVCGLDPIHAPIADIAQHVGLVFQDPESQFLASSVAEEVAFGLESLGVPTEAMPARIQAALEQVGMQNYIDRSPHQLSGGQKQRVAIASILAMQPEVLVLDEAEASLDPAGAAELRQVLEGLRQDQETTIILITNQADWIDQLADHVVVMAEGTIKMQGTPDEVFRQVERLQELGLRPPELHRLQHQLGRHLQQEFNFSSWAQARRAIDSIILGQSQ